MLNCFYTNWFLQKIPQTRHIEIPEFQNGKKSKEKKQKLLDPNKLHETSKIAVHTNSFIPEVGERFQNQQTRHQRMDEQWIVEKVQGRRYIKWRKRNTQDVVKKEKFKKEDTRCSKSVRRSIKKDKEIYIEQLTNEEQTAADTHNSKELYKKTWLLKVNLDTY